MNEGSVPPPPVPEKKTSGLAVASLVLACCSLIGGCLTGIPALVCGVIAMAKISKDPRQGGWGMALAGTIIGGIMTFILPIVLAIAIPALGGAMEGARNTLELNQLRQVGMEMTEYANSHDGKFPDSFEFIGDGNAELRKMIYRSDSSEARWDITPGLTLGSPPETVLLRSAESSGSGSRRGRAVYTVGGTARWIRDGD